MSIKEVRENLKSIIDRVASGEEVVLLRRGKEIARLVPVRQVKRRLPSMEVFRSAITLKGEPMSAEVIRERQEQRD